MQPGADFSGDQSRVHFLSSITVLLPYRLVYSVCYSQSMPPCLPRRGLAQLETTQLRAEWEISKRSNHFLVQPSYFLMSASFSLLYDSALCVYLLSISVCFLFFLGISPIQIIPSVARLEILRFPSLNKTERPNRPRKTWSFQH